MASTRSFLQAHYAHAHLSHRKKRTTRTGAPEDEALDDEPPFISSSRDASEEDNDDADVPSDAPSSPRTGPHQSRARRRSAPLGVIREAALVDDVATLGVEAPKASTAGGGLVDLPAANVAAPAAATSAAQQPDQGSGVNLPSGPTAASVVGKSSSPSAPDDNQPPAANGNGHSTNGGISAEEATLHALKLHRLAPSSDAEASLASDEAPASGAESTTTSISSREQPPPGPRHAHAHAHGHAHFNPQVPDSTTPYDGDVEFAARPAPHPSPASAAVVPGPGLVGGGTAPPPAPRSSWGHYPQRLESELAQDWQNPASPTELRAWFHDAIYRAQPGERDYTIAKPPGDGRDPSRPVRIYADGVYDLFHYAHALQLRQAKLAFPCVHLIVGVCSSAACKAHKNEPVMSSAERYAAVANCRWVDEVLEDAPWVVDQTLLDALQIDYVAHDEEPYAGPAGASDVYRFVKDQGRFLPTRRTPGVSTSELLFRIVDVYKSHALDKKLEKVEIARSQAASRVQSAAVSAAPSRRSSLDEKRA